MATEQTRDPETGKFSPTAEGEALEGAETPRKDIEESPRFQAMQRARKKRAEEHGLTVEGGAGDEEDEDKTKLTDGAASKLTLHGDEEKEKPKPEAEEKPKPKGDGADDGTAGASFADDAIVELKVNGETKKLKWADAKKHLQLGLASEETLARAKDRAAEIKASADAELAAARAARAVVGDPAPGAPPVKEPTEAEKAKAVYDGAKTKMREARAKFAQATQYGTQEDVDKAGAALNEAEDAVDDARDKFAEAARPRPEPQADPLVEREKIDTSKASTDFAKNFEGDRKDKVFNSLASVNMREEIITDLTKLDPTGKIASALDKLTDEELGVHHFRARSRGLVRTLDQVFNAAGTRAREELKTRTAGATPARDPVAERKNRKENTPPAPREAAGRVPEPEDEKPKTGHDLVAEARRRRGKG